MKKILFTLLAAVGCTAVSAQQYEINGTAPSGVLKVFLRNFESQQVDSAFVADGKFSFKGNAEGKIFGQVSAENAKSLYIILDGNVTVDLAQGTAVGTPENDGLTAWTAKLDAPVNTLRTLQQQAQSMRREGTATEEKMRELSAKYDSAMAQVVGGMKQMCEENMQMKYPALYLGLFGTYLGNDFLVDLSEKQPAYFQVSLLHRLTMAIKGWTLQKEGAEVVDFVMADTTGVERHLTEFVGKGKYVLVDFWASWCGPCRQEMPEVKKIYEQYKDKGFDIVGVSLDNNKKAWTGAIKKMELPWHHISDLKGWNCEGAAIYGINSIPATILYGPDGKVVASGLRAHQLAEKLAEVLK